MIETVRDLNKKYTGEWLVLANTKIDEHGNLTEGEVLVHSKDKDSVFNYISSNKVLRSSTSIRYGGYIPEGFVVEI